MKDETKRGLLFCIGIDIVANEVAIRPDLPLRAARQARLVQGVLDTNVETLLMDDVARIGAVSDQLAKRPDAGEWLVLRQPNDAAFQKVVLSKDVRERIKADLAQGYAVVIPRNPVASDLDEAFGWWRIDPESGQTLGINGDGWGTSMGEYAASSLVFFGACLAGQGAWGKVAAKQANRNTIKCAVAALGFGLIAAASVSAVALRLFIAGSAATGAGVGMAF